VFQTRKIVPLLVAIALLLLAIIYGNINPENSPWFPKCPFKLLTGYNCAGCGSQRATHHLLHLDIAGAFKENALFVCFIPYIIFGLSYDFFKPKNRFIEKIHQHLYRGKAAWIILSIIILFWILRNVFGF
jgi:hypothetical protein